MSIKKLCGAICLAVATFSLGMGMASATPLKVVASFSVLADVAHEVGGNKVKVTSLVPRNGDPHELEPTPRDAEALKQADLVFVSGFGLEGWMNRLVAASGYNGHPVDASTGITPLQLGQENGHHGGGGADDPHVWNSVANVKVWVNNIEQALAHKDPANAGYYRTNAAHYRQQLDQLEAYVRKAIATVPAGQRKVLTSHDALGYYGNAYGVTFMAPQGLSTSSEASARSVAMLITQIKREHIKAYFFENSNDPRLVKQIAGATGAKPSGELYVEALSSKEGPAADYVKMMRYNTDEMVAAMQGKVR